MPSPASSSLPVSTVLQSSSVEVSTSETVTSSISSVVSAVSSTVTTQNPSPSVPVTSTTPEPSTSETTTTTSVIDTTPSTVTDNTTESSVTTSSVDIETTPSSVPGNNTENSTTAAVSSSTVTTTTTSTTTTTTTPRPTTTTPTPTISVNVVRVYWVVTVLKVPLSVDVNNQTFIASMELKLATAYVMAFERQKQIAEGTFEPLRRRRAAQVQDTVVNIVNATRTLGTGNVTFVYNITKNGTEVRSEEAVRTLGLLSDQEMALTLGYVVAEKASTYYGRNSASSVPEETSNLWIMGVAVAAVVIVIIVIWVIFCFIIKKRGPESEKDGEPPHLLRMKGGNKSDESVEMVQSPSNSTHNLKKRQSYEVTNEADLEDPTYAVVKKPGKKMEDSTAGDSATLASDDTGLLPSPSKKGRRKKKKKPASEEFDNIEKESYLGSSAPPHPVREPKSLSVEDETEYQRKVAEERRKNKKRLREKRRREGQKKEDTEDMMKEYLAVQEEIDSVLEAPPQEGEIPEVFKSSTSKG
uniref:Zonadhesin n=1 Tax=Magallana gigas TaxID=29159 RepID=K1PJS4_MAGGI